MFAISKVPETVNAQKLPRHENVGESLTDNNFSFLRCVSVRESCVFHSGWIFSTGSTRNPAARNCEPAFTDQLWNYPSILKLKKVAKQANPWYRNAHVLTLTSERNNPVRCQILSSKFCRQKRSLQCREKMYKTNLDKLGTFPMRYETQLKNSLTCVSFIKKFLFLIENKKHPQGISWIWLKDTRFSVDKVRLFFFWTVYK